jgi:hypothetical protein
MLSFGERVNQANDLSRVLDLATARPSPEPFIRRGRRPDPGSPFDIHGGFDNVFEAAPDTSSGTPGLTPSAPFQPTPRPLPIVTQRLVPPGGDITEDKDFHAALAKMLKPRKSG